MTAPALWTSAEAAGATSGVSTSDWVATGVSIDSRTLQRGDLFVALAGPSFDGHEFVADAFARRAAAAMVARQIDRPDAPLLVVDDTMAALQALGRAARARTGARICAITGSVGKTGAKEALRHVLAQQGTAAASRSSLNNHWGVPLSLARMPADADWGVFEIGMNHPGEITPLSRLVRPHVAVVTTVEAAHTEFFDSVEDIARAKAEIFAGMSGGAAILNRDNAHFDLLAAAATAAGVDEIVGFGRAADAEMRLTAVSTDELGSDLSIDWRGRGFACRVGQPGIPWATNALAVLAAAAALGADVDQAAAGLATLPGLPGRGAVSVIRWGNGEIRVIDDSYNANPASMRAALETLGSLSPKGGRRVAILGDMLELGEESAAHHAALAEVLDACGIDVVYLAGEHVNALAGALPEGRVAAIRPTAAALQPLVLAGLAEGDVVAVKGSRGIGLERIVDALLEAASANRAANGN